jgi:outer membrane protein, multidrug efflux system
LRASPLAPLCRQQIAILPRHAARRRALLEHAIASLIGKPASSFAIPPASLSVFAPKIPAGAPLDLLERRPDIAAAERQVAAANAQIGVAKAAFFPRVMINLSGGTQDTGLSLFNFRNSIWTLGPTITLPIFDAGQRNADLAGADAAYLETAAHYRSTVLLAYQEVEDTLSNLRWLSNAQRSMDLAASAAQKVLNISLTLYATARRTILISWFRRPRCSRRNPHRDRR